MTINTPYPLEAFRIAAQALADTGKELHAMNWTPATSSNFSVRLNDSLAAITISGRHKGRLSADDIMVVDWNGQAVGSNHRPSAETLLHTRLYQRYPHCGAVLHTHSLIQTVASRLYAQDGVIVLDDYELLKAFAGNQTHDTTLELPVFANTQDMVALSQQVDEHLILHPNLYGYLIDGHGIYAWGKDLNECRRHLDAFEFLLSCELELRKFARH